MKNICRRIGVKVMCTVVAATSLVVVGPAPANASSSDCASGYMCVWSAGVYSGTMKRFSATGYWAPIGLSSVGSYYNHRTRRVLMSEYSNGSGRVICIDAGEKLAFTSGWLTHPGAVYLSTASFC